MQELLKTGRHRWAWLIRRQPGLKGLEKPAWKENDRNQAKGGDFSHPFILKQLLCKKPPTGWGSSSGDPPALHWCSSLHASFFMLMYTSGCCLAVVPGWGSQESHPVYRLSNGLQTHYQQCCVAVEAWRLHHISTVSATTPNSMAGECRGVCVCVCVCASLQVCARHSVERKVAALKASLIRFYTVSHFWSWSKVIGHWSLPTDLNFMTMAGNYPRIHTSSIFKSV